MQLLNGTVDHVLLGPALLGSAVLEKLFRAAARARIVASASSAARAREAGCRRPRARGADARRGGVGDVEASRERDCGEGEGGVPRRQGRRRGARRGARLRRVDRRRRGAQRAPPYGGRRSRGPRRTARRRARRQRGLSAWRRGRRRGGALGEAVGRRVQQPRDARVKEITRVRQSMPSRARCMVRCGG